MLTWLKKWIWFGLFLSLMGLVNFLLPILVKPSPPVKVTQNQLEEYMLNANAIRYDTNGEPREKLDIEGIYHHQDQDFVILKNPKLILKRDDTQWIIKAKTGKSYHPKNGPFERLVLEENVVINLNQQSPESWRMETSNLVVYPKRQVANTKNDVIIFSDSLTIEGIGMHADFKLGRIDLSKQVKTTYETQSS